MKVLFISALYPNRYDKMNGLFVRKHAQAVSRFCDVRVLYVQVSTEINKFEICTDIVHKVKETIVYYPAGNSFIGRKVIKQLNYLRAYYKGWKQFSSEGFKPDITHANILTRTVLIAYIIQKFTAIPYVLTEHWSRYLAGNKAFDRFLDRRISKIVLRHAKAIMPVSQILQNGMLSHGLYHPNYQIVNNVVDDNFTNSSHKIHFSKTQILHVSCFDEQSKNISGMLRVFRELCNQRSDFEVDFVGTGINYNESVELYRKLNFPKNTLKFSGEISPEQVAEKFKKSDIFVLFSNYETAAVVLAESLVSGVPIISTKVGIALEYIDKTNGILVDKADEEALLQALNEMIDNLQSYDNEAIMNKFKDKFSYQTIGGQIYNIYKEILK